MKAKSNYRYKLMEWSPWLAGVSVILGGNWAAAVIREQAPDWITKHTWTGTWLDAFYLVFFMVAVAWLYQSKNKFFRPRSRHLRDNRSPPKREYLILFLSDLKTTLVKHIDGVPDGLTLTNNLDEDLKNCVKYKTEHHHYWPWEMTLRAIHHHAAMGGFKGVALICSPQSITQAHWFKKIADRYPLLKDKISLLKKENDGMSLVSYDGTEVSSIHDWHFEQFDDLSLAVTGLLLHYNRQGIADRKMTIDFTGGQKVTSVVAASATFNRDVRVQYVQTSEPWHVLGYDIMLGSSDSLGI